MTVSVFNCFVEQGNVDWHPLSIAHGIDFFLFNRLFTLSHHQVLRAKDDHDQDGGVCNKNITYHAIDDFIAHENLVFFLRYTARLYMDGPPFRRTAFK
jgi:hypothetical protein